MDKNKANDGADSDDEGLSENVEKNLESILILFPHRGIKNKNNE